MTTDEVIEALERLLEELVQKRDRLRAEAAATLLELGEVDAKIQRLTNNPDYAYQSKWEDK